MRYTPICALFLFLASVCLAASPSGEKGLSERLTALEGASPKGMSADAWARHLALAKYYRMCLDLQDAKDQRTIDALARRGATAEATRRQLTEVVTAMETGKDAFAGRTGAFRAAYVSQADGAAQPYVIYVPKDYDASKPWPLSVELHGAGGSSGVPDDFGGARPHLAIRVDGRGIASNYANLSERDVLDAIADVRRFYNVDESRIYLFGVSMGGFGTWSLACRYPDLFAASAAYCGAPGVNAIENLSNLPIWLLHDDADWAVVIDRERWAGRLLKKWGYPVKVNVSHGFGHDAPAGAARAGLKIDEWLLAQRRSDAPQSVVYTTTAPSRGKAYWVAIRELADPSLPATVRAKAASRSCVELSLENVATLEVSLPEKLFDRKAAIEIALDSASLAVGAPAGEKVFVHRKGDGWEVSKENPVRTSGVRSYEAGALANLYSGEPLLIVRGTSGPEGIVRAMEGLAAQMKGFTSNWEPMDFATIPVKKDTEVTDDDIRTRNLVLIGGPSQNVVTKSIADKLPATEKDGKVVLEGTLSYDLKGRGYTLYHYNPLAPDRLVYVIASGDEAFYNFRNGFLDTALANGPAIDFSLMDVRPLKYVRLMSWSADWKPAARFTDSPKLSAAYGDAAGYWGEFAIALRKLTEADYAVCPCGPKNDRANVSFDTASATTADLDLYLGRQPVVAAEVTGSELADIIRALSTSGEGRVLPDPPQGALGQAKMSRIAMTEEMNRYIARNRQRNIDTLEFVTFQLTDGFKGGTAKAAP